MENKVLIVTDAPSTFLRRKTIRNHFGTFGTITNFSIKNGTCVIVFQKRSEAEEAKANGTVWRDISINIDWFEPSKLSEDQILNYEEELNWNNSCLFSENSEKTRTLSTHKIKRNELIKIEDTAIIKDAYEAFIPKMDEDSLSKEVVYKKTPDNALLNKVALSLSDKFQILEERDKLLRRMQDKDSNIKTATAMRGTCPDMCPEKERIMRDLKRITSVYEMVPGTSEIDPRLAVKEYSRSSADQEEPLQHELRPEPVLSMTMAYLITNVMSRIDRGEENISDWYDFCWDRLRAIRKDIVQQQLSDINTVTIVEQCARFHICCFDRMLGTDMNIFDHKINTENLMNCLKSLMNMYEDLRKQGVVCPNEAEFNAYMILLKLNSGDIMWEYQKFPSVLQCSREVQQAVTIHAIYNNNMYSRFFKIVQETSYLNACLMQRFFTHVRTRALKTIIKAYCPRHTRGKLSLDLVMDSLKFDSAEESISFCETYGINFVDHETGFRVLRHDLLQSDTQWTVRSTSGLITEKRMSFPQAVVGAKNNVPIYIEHEVHNSFDENNILKQGALDASDQEEKFLRDIIMRDLFMKKKMKTANNQMEQFGTSIQSEVSTPESLSPHPHQLNMIISVGTNSTNDAKFDDFSNSPYEEDTPSTDEQNVGSELISTFGNVSEESESSDESEMETDDTDLGHVVDNRVSTNTPQARSNADNVGQKTIPSFNIKANCTNSTFISFDTPKKHVLDFTKLNNISFPKTVVKSPDSKVSERSDNSQLFKKTKESPKSTKFSDDIVMQKLKKKLHESMKVVSVRKYARIWKQKIERIKKSRNLFFDQELPFLCELSLDDYSKFWGTKIHHRRYVPLVQRFKACKKADLMVKAILNTSIVDMLDADVKLIGEKVSEMLGKGSVEYAWKYSNIAQPSPVYWKLVFAIPPNTVGSTFPAKLRKWCNEAFYSSDQDKIGDVEYRMTSSGVPTYINVRIIEGDQLIHTAENMSTLILIRVDGCESLLDTKLRLLKFFKYKTRPLPLAILTVGETFEQLSSSDLEKNFTCVYERVWNNTESLMDTFSVLIRHLDFTETKVQHLSMILEIITDKFIDNLHEDSYLTYGLAIVLREPNNIIILFNELIEKFKAMVLKCYESNIFGTAFEFKPYIHNKNYTQNFPDLYNDPNFVQIFVKLMESLKLAVLEWPPESSLHLYKLLKQYCSLLGCDYILSKIIRMINPPDDEDPEKDLQTHLAQIQWLQIVEIFIKESIRVKKLNFKIVYRKNDADNLVDSHWWMYTDLVIKANKSLTV